VISLTPRPLYPRGKSPPYALDRRLGGPQSRSGRRGEEKILGLELRSLGRPARSQSLYRLRYPGSITPCSLLKVNRRYRGTCRLHFQGLSEARNQQSLPLAFTLVSSTLKMEGTCSSEMSVNFQRTTRCYIPEDKTPQFNSSFFSFYVYNILIRMFLRE
jgi:hypothetical protein